MKKNLLSYTTFLFLIFGLVLGFSSLNDNPKKDISPMSSKTSPVKTLDAKNFNGFESDNNGGSNQTSGLPYYTDNFDGANDTAALKSRGYLVYYRGGGAQVASTWFQGNPSVFSAFNGPTNGYVGANYQVVGGTNNIDSWLVLPRKSVAAADSIVFYSRSVLDNPYPDSVRVMYSAAGDSVPEASWTELGRFLVNTSGSWERKAFGAPVGGANARYAIRYNVVNGGPSGDNSNYIGVDALTLETTPIANDVATLSIDSVYNYALPVNTIAPRATFQNGGTANQTNIPVTYKVTGPVNYTNSKVINSLAAGAVTQVVFDSTFLPNIVGTYNITVYSSLANDGYRGNDTLRTSFFVVQPNYGGGGPNSGGYYFANSTPDASVAPSQPTYCRVDTAGSTTLVSNSVAAISVSSGTLDDGYWTLSGLTGLKRIKFMGELYSDVYLGTNGIIAFAPYTSNVVPPGTGLPGGTARPAIYPAWNDIDWSDPIQPINRLSYKIDAAKSRLVITYDRAPIYGGTATMWETFQVCIDLVDNNAGSPNSNITISHSNSTTVLSLPYLVGIQDGTGANYIQYTFIDGGGNVISPGPLFDTTANGGVSVTFGPNPNTLNGPCDKILALTTSYEACLSPSQIFVLLRNATSPYAIVDSVVATGGADTQYPVYFDNAGNGVSYYVVVKSVNSIETWSSSTVTFNGGSTSYDFTTSISQAYGNNQTLNVNNVPSIYQGDANQDGACTLTDLIDTYNVATAFSSSPETDFDCNVTTDLTDIILASNNGRNFIQKQRP